MGNLIQKRIISTKMEHDDENAAAATMQVITKPYTIESDPRSTTRELEEWHHNSTTNDDWHDGASTPEKDRGFKKFKNRIMSVMTRMAKVDVKKKTDAQFDCTSPYQSILPEAVLPTPYYSTYSNEVPRMWPIWSDELLKRGIISPTSYPGYCEQLHRSVEQCQTYDHKGEHQLKLDVGPDHIVLSQISEKEDVVELTTIDKDSPMLGNEHHAPLPSPSVMSTNSSDATNTCLRKSENCHKSAITTAEFIVASTMNAFNGSSIADNQNSADYNKEQEVVNINRPNGNDERKTSMETMRSASSLISVTTDSPPNHDINQQKSSLVIRRSPPSSTSQRNACDVDGLKEKSDSNVNTQIFAFNGDTNKEQKESLLRQSRKCKRRTSRAVTPTTSKAVTRNSKLSNGETQRGYEKYNKGNGMAEQWCMLKDNLHDIRSTLEQWGELLAERHHKCVDAWLMSLECELQYHDLRRLQDRAMPYETTPSAQPNADCSMITGDIMLDKLMSETRQMHLLFFSFIVRSTRKHRSAENTSWANNLLTRIDAVIRIVSVNYTCEHGTGDDDMAENDKGRGDVATSYVHSEGETSVRSGLQELPTLAYSSSDGGLKYPTHQSPSPMPPTGETMSNKKQWRGIIKPVTFIPPPNTGIETQEQTKPLTNFQSSSCDFWHQNPPRMRTGKWHYSGKTEPATSSISNTEKHKELVCQPPSDGDCRPVGGKEGAKISALLSQDGDCRNAANGNGTLHTPSAEMQLRVSKKSRSRRTVATVPASASSDRVINEDIPNAKFIFGDSVVEQCDGENQKFWITDETVDEFTTFQSREDARKERSYQKLLSYLLVVIGNSSTAAEISNGDSGDIGNLDDFSDLDCEDMNDPGYPTAGYKQSSNRVPSVRQVTSDNTIPTTDLPSSSAYDESYTRGVKGRRGSSSIEVTKRKERRRHMSSPADWERIFGEKANKNTKGCTKGVSQQLANASNANVNSKRERKRDGHEREKSTTRKKCNVQQEMKTPRKRCQEKASGQKNVDDGQPKQTDGKLKPNSNLANQSSTCSRRKGFDCSQQILDDRHLYHDYCVVKKA